MVSPGWGGAVIISIRALFGHIYAFRQDMTANE